MEPPGENMKKYTKKELIEALIEFRDKNGEFPTRQNFKDRTFPISTKPYYNNFGGLEKAIEFTKRYQSGEAELEEYKIHVEREGFNCPFCNSFTTGADKFFSTLNYTLASRYTANLKEAGSQEETNGIFKCIFSTFHVRNKRMNEFLSNEGYLEAYLNFAEKR